MTEVPSQGSFGAVHINSASPQSGVDIFWNVDSVTVENVFILTVDAAKG